MQMLMFARLILVCCKYVCLDCTTAESHQIAFATAEDKHDLESWFAAFRPRQKDWSGPKSFSSDALSCIHVALAGVACMTLISFRMLQCRGSKQSKQPAVAVTACIIRNGSSSSGLPSPSGSIPTPTPAVTPPVAASANPVWNHCLSCQFAEGQMQTGQLQLALLNETDGTILTR